MSDINAGAFDATGAANPVTSSPIKNVFVLMLENHSFDHVFAMSKIPGLRAATTADSNSYDGQKYYVKGGAPPFMTTDPGHEFQDVAEQLSGGNQGFAENYAKSCSEDTGRPAADHVGDIMACFDTPTQLPVIYQLASEYAICDQWYSSMPGPTWPNRFFVHGASSACLDRSPKLLEEVEWESHVHGFCYENGSIYQALTAAKQQWRLYSDLHNRYRDASEWTHGGWIPQVASLKGVSIFDVHPLDSSRDSTTWADNFANDLKQDYPYAYTFIEPNFGTSFFDKQPPFKGPRYKCGSSQHPEDDAYGGECLIKAVYEAIRNSPLWETSLLVIVYDEHGGFYDHVSPPPAPAPGDRNVNHLKDLNGFDFKRFGVRVPAVVISPLIAKGTVDHTKYDHTSILATVQRMLGMGNLTARDLAANDLRPLFTGTPLRPDADCPRALVTPVPPTTNPCAAQPVDIDQPLPETGNWVGFLKILLKTELEMHQGDQAACAGVLERFKTITTTNAAKEYMQFMGEKIAAVRASAVNA